MAFCQECGSEVAPNDIYCPFCGITLQTAHQFAAESAPVSAELPSAAPSKSPAEDEIAAPQNTPFENGGKTDHENDSLPVNSPVLNSSPFDDDDFDRVSSGTASPVNEAAEPLKTEVTEKNETEDPLILPENPFPTAQSAPENSAAVEQPKEEFIFDDIDKFDSKISEAHEKFDSQPPPLIANIPIGDSTNTPEIVETPLPSNNSTSAEKIDFDEPSPVRTFAPAVFPVEESIEKIDAVDGIYLPAPNHETPNPPAIENYQIEPEKAHPAIEANDSIVEPADLDATLAYIPPESLKSFQIENDPPKTSPAVVNPFTADEPENIEKSAEPAPGLQIDAPISAGEKISADTPIFKPADELELHDSNPPVNQFDSVRIFEDQSFGSPEIPLTATQPIDNERQTEAGQAQLVETPSAQIAGQSSTEQGTSVAPPATNDGTNDSNGKKAAKLKPLDEGTVLNSRYEIIRKIGGGGMGAVYLAADNNLGGVLRAVKEMVQSYIEENQQEKAVNDFKRESMILSTLDHPAIPTIYDYFYDDKESRFYLVMKYINGGDLSVKLRSTPAGKIDEKSVTEWGIQIADVLDYLHNRPSPVIYRDLKPANVMIDDNSGRVMLIDFGIARSVNKEEKGVTAVGTMGYAPPELFSGNVEPRSDIYSLGSTMFHLLTGADPQSNPLLIFDFQKNPRPRQINSQLSDQMERILMRAVEYNADARFESAAEMRRCLQEHLENFQRNNVTYGVKEVPAAVSLEDQPVFCGFCGQRIMATDMFCAFCGAKQPLSQKGVHSEIYARSLMTARVIVQGTNELDSATFDLDKDQNLIGRRDPLSNIFPELDLSKFDPQTKVSRRHALIKVNGNSYTVEDLGSSNGTTVIAAGNTMRLLPHQPQLLNSGDKIRVGDTMLNFFAN